MTSAILAAMLSLMPASAVHAGQQEDWILSVYYSTNTPAIVRRAFAEKVKDIRNQERRQANLEARLKEIQSGKSIQPAAAGVQASPASSAEDFHFRNVYAFPNPAVGAQKATVHLAVGKADKVTFRFFDVSGQQIHEATLNSDPAMLDDGSGPELSYEYIWDGHIPSGVYLYTVTAEKSGHSPIRKTGKLAIVR